MDPEAASIQANEPPEVTLDRTRHLLARSRMTLDAANRRLHRHDDERDSPSQNGDSAS